MNLNKLKSIIDKLDECDSVIAELTTYAHRTPFDGYSQYMKECLHGAVIERRINLLDQMKRQGIEVEV